MRLHGEAAAQAMGGTLEGVAREITGVSIDSRTLKEGQLFFAIRGPRFDGHQFVAHAFVRGAAGAVVRDGFQYPRENLRDRFLVRVTDPTQALGRLAHEERLESGATIVAITGSLGKTTTKEAAAAAIGTDRPVFCSSGNLNNQWGLPLSLLAREEDKKVGVVELGMSAPGEIRTLAKIAAPNVGLVTNVSEAHLESFDSIEQIAVAKGELFEALPAEGIAVVNANDERVRAQANRFPGEKLTFGFGCDAKVRGLYYDPLAPGLSFAVRYEDQAASVRCSLRGRHNASNVLGGLAAAVAVGVPLKQAAKGVAQLKALPGRGQRTELRNGAILVDETYNSSPRALMTVLHELDMETKLRHRPEVAVRLILVVGDMLELGVEGERLHRECAHFACAMKLDLTIGVGALGQLMAKTMGQVGEPVKYAEDPEAAADFLVEELGCGDVVLFKASRAVGMERAIEALKRALGGDA